MQDFRNIEFVTGVAAARDLPPARGAEVAFAGRSNAGKSSAINTIVQRKRMAFVSKTPGRTQQINFFRVGDQRYLVDLPGYGYAAVPKAARAQWHELIGQYLHARSSLRGIVLIMDARHPLTPLDRQLLDWLTPGGRPLHVLLSKADKLGKQEAVDTLRRATADLRGCYSDCSVQLFSSTRKIGVVEAAPPNHAWHGAGRNKKTPVKGE